MRKAIAVALVVAFTASILNADPKRLECTIATPDHPEPRPLFMLRIDGVDYLDVHDVALLFRATRTWHADVGRMLLDVGGEEVELILGTPSRTSTKRGTTATRRFSGKKIAWSCPLRSSPR